MAKLSRKFNLSASQRLARTGKKYVFHFEFLLGLPRSSDCEDAFYDPILLGDDVDSRDGYRKGEQSF